MPNRRLIPTELEDARLLLTMVRAGLRQLAGDDADLLFALRRKVYKELSYDERDKPTAAAGSRHRSVRSRAASALSAQGRSLKEIVCWTGSTRRPDTR